LGENPAARHRRADADGGERVTTAGTMTEARTESAKVMPNEAVSIYEVHLDSWRRVPEEQNRPLTNAEIAPQLAAYARWMNFTHVQFLAPERETKDLANYLCEHEIGVVAEGEEYWDKVWATETLNYFSHDPFDRKNYQHQQTNRESGSFLNGMVLPLSHLLVCPPQPSLLARMPGDDWRKFAHMRLLFAEMFALPGRKLIFMGDEFGQWNAWNSATSLDWHLVNENNLHGRLQRWVAELNWLYQSEPALHETGTEALTWIDRDNAEWCVAAWLRHAPESGERILAVFNFTPEPRHNYRVGVPGAGFWKEMLNSDAVEYGGSGQGNLGGVEAAPFGWHCQTHSLTITLPPLGAVFFKQTEKK
jgi:1,4-alpha-glucan branching enzyme